MNKGGREKEVMKYTHRIRYWRQKNEEFGEWVLTGLMSQKDAEVVAANLRKTHDEVYVVEDVERTPNDTGNQP